MKTPCEEAGYKVGDVFEIIVSRPELGKYGTAILKIDDGSQCPLFRGYNRDNLLYTDLFLRLNEVKKIDYIIGSKYRVMNTTSSGFSVGTIVTLVKVLGTEGQFTNGGAIHTLFFSDLEKINEDYTIGKMYKIVNNTSLGFEKDTIVVLIEIIGASGEFSNGEVTYRHSLKDVERVVGVKHDSDKLAIGLIDPEWLESIAGVLTFGADKYKQGNWKLVDKKRYLDAAYRHLVAYHKGELNDKESGLPHLSHLSCCIMFLHYLENKQR